jgi:hypothetical protein
MCDCRGCIRYTPRVAAKLRAKRASTVVSVMRWLSAVDLLEGADDSPILARIIDKESLPRGRAGVFDNGRFYPRDPKGA